MSEYGRQKYEQVTDTFESPVCRTLFPDAFHVRSQRVRSARKMSCNIFLILGVGRYYSLLFGSKTPKIRQNKNFKICKRRRNNRDVETREYICTIFDEDKTFTVRVSHIKLH